MPDSTAPPVPSMEGAQAPLASYFKHLSTLEKQETATIDQIVAVMVARSDVQEWLTGQVGAEALAMIVQLDNRLKAQADKLGPLADCRSTLQPSESQWWWFLSPSGQPPASAERTVGPRWSRWDWLWNLGTVACLVVSTGLISQTAKAFSEEGFDLLGTVSTIGQGAGLALVARGGLDRSVQAKGAEVSP